jgi:pectinesterase
MNIFKPFFLLALILLANSIQAQDNTILSRRWTDVANKMPEKWYGSEESKRIADNVLIYQRNIGGWPKNTAFHAILAESDKEKILKEKGINDAIFDNGATTTEIRFLSTMYQKTGNEAYKDAALKGVQFILKAQYENGGWPMFYPLHKGYYTHITFNDDAIFRMMELLKDIYSKKSQFAYITDPKFISDCQNAWERGLQCILKTQIVVNGKPTVWCAQHDEVTFEPAKARAYELPSFSGSESVGLLEILMEIKNPTPEIIKAVQGAVEWFDAHKITNLKVEIYKGPDGKPDKRVVTSPDASPLWARFYDLETGQPFFCDRDGIKKSKLEEIGYERRNGYGWYTDRPQKTLDKYPAWKAKWLK